MGKAGGGQVDEFACKAVHAVAGHELEVGGHMAARQPLRKEGGDHGIAHGKFRHACAHGRDQACAVGHGNAAVGRRAGAAHHAQVVVVERAGVNAYLDLAGGGCRRCRQVDKLQMFETAGGGQLHDFHGVLLKR
jgi:hypothetical protein